MTIEIHKVEKMSYLGSDFDISPLRSIFNSHLP